MNQLCELNIHTHQTCFTLPIALRRVSRSSSGGRSAGCKTPSTPSWRQSSSSWSSSSQTRTPSATSSWRRWRPSSWDRSSISSTPPGTGKGRNCPKAPLAIRGRIWDLSWKTVIPTRTSSNLPLSLIRLAIPNVRWIFSLQSLLIVTSCDRSVYYRCLK